MTTLLEIRNRVRQKADIESDSVRHTDAELDVYINNGVRELYALAMRYGILRVEKKHTITADGSTSYALPSDWLGTIGVWLERDNFNLPLQNHDVRSRPFEGVSWDGNADWAGSYRTAFFDDGTAAWSMELHPKPTSGTFIHMYIPTPPVLALDADVLTVFLSVLGWDNFVVFSAAIEARQKDDVPWNDLAAARGQIEARVAEEAELRELAQGGRVYNRRRRGFTDPADIRWARSGDTDWY